MMVLFNNVVDQDFVVHHSIQNMTTIEHRYSTLKIAMINVPWRKPRIRDAAP